ncbi:MAG: Uma2 family endonuclease [Spirochaetaceae bacterium]|nr:Uma2 family endonuclease [Spirochaetaceae bacterium]
MSSIPLNKYFTLQDYFSLPYKGNEEPRFELIDGIMMMSPSPSNKHQQIMLNLTRQLANFFDDKACQVFFEFDVKLFPRKATVYCPDLIVVCNSNQITEQYIDGPPNFIIEVGSPGTLHKDLTKKRTDYERAGVNEYWVVDGVYRVYTYLLNENNKYDEIIYEKQKEIPVKSFTGLTISFERLQKML